MIVDTHYHYIPFPRSDLLPMEILRNWVLTGELAGVKKSMNEATPIYHAYINDPDCQKLINRMVESGVDVTILLIMDNLHNGLSIERLVRFRERCANAVAGHPQRLLALVGVDPRRTEAPSLVRKLITDFKMRGLKWHPASAEFYPNCPEAYAVLKVADELGVPLLVHTGPLPEYASKYAHPLNLDDIAHDFPNLKIIAAHLDEGWRRDWMAIAKYKCNIYGDLAIWQIPAASKPHLFRRDLREILDTVGPARLLFVSDGPILEPFVSNRITVETIKTLTQRGTDGITFSEEEVTGILGSTPSGFLIFR